jgi:hypothetical protein
MRNLKIRLENIGNMYEYEVLEQSHRGYNFAPDNDSIFAIGRRVDLDSSIVYKIGKYNICLRSQVRPEIKMCEEIILPEYRFIYSKYGVIVFVRGSNPSFDNLVETYSKSSIIHFSNKFENIPIDEIMEAVAIYNNDGIGFRRISIKKKEEGYGRKTFRSINNTGSK